MLCYAFAGCNKDTSGPSLLVHRFAVESIIAPDGNQSTTNKCFLNLYEGVAYTKAEAEAQSSKVDFAYNYKGPGCNTCRFFENVSDMSNRTNYVASFSKITQSRISMSEFRGELTIAGFDSIQSVADIEQLFSRPIRLERAGDITNSVTDNAICQVFAFEDKEGRKGVFKIDDYIANVPGGDKATLQLTVKVPK